MGGNTGNIRTLRNQSGTVGQRTLGSIIASDSGNGAGSIARLAKWYAARGPYNGTAGFYDNELGIKKGSLSGFSHYKNSFDNRLQSSEERLTQIEQNRAQNEEIRRQFNLINKLGGNTVPLAGGVNVPATGSLVGNTNSYTNSYTNPNLNFKI